MRILVIDDLRVFDAGSEDELVYARTPAEAMARLRDGHWDQVWFDHDLGLAVDDDGTRHHLTAMPVAEELEAAAHGAAEPVSVGEVYVHTDNVTARPRLLAALRRYHARYVPASAVTVAVLDPPGQD